MAKDVITVDGKEVVVREDTAKAYRGINWAFASIALFLAVLMLLFAVFYFRPVGSPAPDGPTQPVQQKP